MARRLTLYILIGMILGVITGYLVRVYVPADTQAYEYWLRSFGTLSTIFLNLIKMLVAPLILATLVSGIAHMGDSSALGRIGTRAIIWFLIASLISISLGLIMVNLLQPGAGLSLAGGALLPGAEGVENLRANAAAARPLSDILIELVPRNPIDSAVRALDGEMLPLMIFALIFGVAVSQIRQDDEPVLVRVLQQIFDACMRIVHFAMYLAPVAVFAIVPLAGGASVRRAMHDG